MNDFTKEELLYLYQLSQYQHAANVNEQVVDKIKNMIDSYCKHANARPFTSFRTRCDDCGEIW